MTPIEEALTSEENNNSSTTSLSDSSSSSDPSTNCGNSSSSNSDCGSSIGEDEQILYHHLSSPYVVQCAPSNIKIVVTSASQENLLEGKEGRKIDVWVKNEDSHLEHENDLARVQKDLVVNVTQVVDDDNIVATEE